MADLRRQLQGLFARKARFENFGEVIERCSIEGFRCHTNVSFSFESPVTAFCGHNGTGKSTIVQLIASAYRGVTHAWERNYIHRFIFVGKLDTAPFLPNASVRYEYVLANSADGNPNSQKVTISRGASRWTGYKRQPKRKTYFAGVGLFLPRIEEWDTATRNATRLGVGASVPISDDTRQHVNAILGTAYDAASDQEIVVRNKNSNVVVVKRGSASYSELHMGSGEGRIYHIVRSLEGLPDRSLAVLEEPETSLHPAAQYRFGQYLINLAIRKRLQVFLTTHSEFLLSALPRESRICLIREGDDIHVIPEASVKQAISLMADSQVKAMHILVEDDVAKAIVTALLRAHEPFLLRTAEIVIVGDKDKLQTIMSVLADQKLSICAVRDADFGENTAIRMFKLFGTLPPEKEIFASAAFQTYIHNRWGLSLRDSMVDVGKRDHHEWFEEIAKRLGITRDQLIFEAVEVYVASVPQKDQLTLIQKLKTSVH